jgi:hypothetical protein
MVEFARFAVIGALAALCSAASAQGVISGGTSPGMARTPGTQGATGTAGASSPASARSLPSAGPQDSPASESRNSAGREKTKRHPFGDPTRRPRPTVSSGASAD